MFELNGNRVAIVGDWHGNSSCLAKIQQIAEEGVNLILSVGDFGIWHPSAYEALGVLDLDSYMMDAEKICGKYNVEIWITLGNHESYGFIDDLWVAQGAFDGDRRLPLQLTQHIKVLPRGYRFKLRNRSFVSLGGANSIDRWYRYENKSWWKQEQISNRDVQLTIEGGPADVMITHESPDPPYCTREIQMKLETKSPGWPVQALLYSSGSREMVTRAVVGVKPKVLFHGHWHVPSYREVHYPDVDYKSDIFSLGMEWQPRNVAILNLTNLEVSFL